MEGLLSSNAVNTKDNTEGNTKGNTKGNNKCNAKNHFRVIPPSKTFLQ
jgi:hypothetical protein